MKRLSTEEMISLIQKEIPFEGVARDYSFTLKIEVYTDLVCAAIHDGHQFRRSLWDKCALNEYQRWYEEDPATKQFIQGFPIVIAGRDSRFEYDLNRSPAECIYAEAWGKNVWKTPLTSTEREHSLAKHGNFYSVAHALIGKLESLHGKVLLIDMHSFNRKRWDREIPTWNLGCANIDTSRYGKVIGFWKERLASLQLPHDIPSVADVNNTFQGNGHFLKDITSRHRNTLVLATEISKVYCNEDDGVIYPEVIYSVKRQWKEIVPELVNEFRKNTP